MSIESRMLKNYTGVLKGIPVTGLPHRKVNGLIQIALVKKKLNMYQILNNPS